MTFSEAVGIIGSIPLPDDLVNDRILDAFGVLKDEAKKQSTNGWIPVSERLPKLDKCGEAYVLVSMDDEFIATTTYTKDGFELWAESGEVTAWQPLPKPYREDGVNG